MKSMFLAVAASAAPAMSGCATNTLPKASSVEDYCEGAASFARIIALERDGLGIDKRGARGKVRYETSMIENLDQKEVEAMIAVVGMVYEQPRVSPEETRGKVYRTCLDRRRNNTWFQAGAP